MYFNIQDVTADEFHSIMEILAWTRLGSTVTGQQELVDITIEQAELSVPFKHTNVEQWNRLVQCIKHALPFFSVCICTCLIHISIYLRTRFNILHICIINALFIFKYFFSVTDRFVKICFIYLRASPTTSLFDDFSRW